MNNLLHAPSFSAPVPVKGEKVESVCGSVRSEVTESFGGTQKQMK